jgi:hypothetical protein
LPRRLHEYSIPPVDAFLEGYTLVPKLCFLIAVLLASLLGAPDARAQSSKTVHCGINASHFWTSSDVCKALMSEAAIVNTNVNGGVLSRQEMLHQCASDIAKKLPGADQATYLNGCDQLLSAVLHD